MARSSLPLPRTAAGRAAAVLALLTALWAVDATLGLGVFWDHDLRHHHHPWRAWAAAEWLSGRVPLWAPGVANGFPLMADGQAGVFYLPGMLLFGLLPGSWALNLTVLLHTWWGGFGAWCLARALGRSGPAALVTAVAWTFSGFLASHALYLGMHCALAWLPWTLWAVERRRHGLAGLCAAMMLVAGHPQAAAFGLLLVGARALWLAGSERATAARRLGGFTLAMVLALAVAAPQLAATVELTGFSMRQGGVSAMFANIGALPPQELVHAVLPEFFGMDRPGDVAETYYHRGDGYWGAGVNHWEMSFYLGVPVVLLAGLALAGHGLKRHVFWVGMGGLATLLMLGGPLWALLRLVPGMDGFRFPARFALVTTLAVAVLAGAGLDAIRAQAGDRLQRWGRRILVLAAVFLVGASVGRGLLVVADAPLRQALTGHFMGQTELPPPPPDLSPLAAAGLPGPEAEDPALVPAKVDRVMASLQADTAPWSRLVLKPTLLTVFLGGLLILAGRGRVREVQVAVALVAVIYADLRAFGGDYQTRQPRAALAEVPAALAVMSERSADMGAARLTTVDRRQDPALDTQLVQASLGLLHGTRDVILTSPLLLVRNEAVLGLAGLDVGDKGAQKWDRLAAHRNIPDLLGVRWLLSTHALAPGQIPGIVEHALDLPAHAQGRVHLYENLSALPRAFLVPCVVPVADAEAAFAALPALDVDAQALVEPLDGQALPDGLVACVGGAPAPAPGKATITGSDPQRMVVEITATAPGLLVLTESWYPGWQATIDGVPAGIWRTDMLFRGVEIAPGTQQVVFEYRPARLRALLVLAPLSAVGLLGWALVGWRRRRLGAGR